MNKPIRNNQTQTHTQTHTKHTPDQRARGGVGRSRVEVEKWKPDSAQEQAPFTERRAREFAFAARVLPEQHPGFCVVAMIAIQMRGETPTRENVLARLTATGREASQIGYGPGGYAA